MTCWTTRVAGGAERFLEQSVAALVARDVPVALLADGDAPVDRARMQLPDGVPCWVGPDAPAAAVRWEPSLVLDHGSGAGARREAGASLAPAVHVAHNYLGTCISGQKTHKTVTPRACSRTLGWPCLLHYFPNHCGGWNPATMASLWRTNRAALDRIRGGAGVLALSRHMADEFVRHGVPADRVRVVSPPVRSDTAGPAAPGPGEPWRVTFVGRFDLLKGARLLVESMPHVAGPLGSPIELTLVGDGPDAANVEAACATVQASGLPVRVRRTGWLPREAVEREISGSHVLAMPSLWPEPFGLVGLEAAAMGVPAVAFAVGGIRDWLDDGVSGVLVRDEPRTAAAFARGLVRVLADAHAWRRLSAGARAVAAHHGHDRFADDLVSAVQQWNGIVGRGDAA
jgi:glycosyltransferase involved in cell wall biosynthesis